MSKPKIADGSYQEIHGNECWWTHLGNVSSFFFLLFLGFFFVGPELTLTCNQTSELTAYQDCIRGFGVAQLNEKFEVLRQIGNLFVVRPENIKGLLEEGALSKVDRRVLHSCITMRSDYKSEKISQYFEEDTEGGQRVLAKSQNLKGLFLALSFFCFLSGELTSSFFSLSLSLSLSLSFFHPDL